MTPTVTQSHRPGESFPEGTTQVVYTFTDVAGNSARCSFEVTVGKWLFGLLSTTDLRILDPLCEPKKKIDTLVLANEVENQVSFSNNFFNG